MEIGSILQEKVYCHENDHKGQKHEVQGPYNDKPVRIELCIELCKVLVKLRYV